MSADPHRGSEDPGSPVGSDEDPVPIVGAVLCGGRSSRFGSDKALAPAGDGLVGDRVVAALRGGGADPVVAIGGTAGPHLGLPTIGDLRPGEGPLAGLATALLWAKTGSVVVVPCDLVLLQAAHVATLIQAGPGAAELGPAHVGAAGSGPAEANRAVVATVDGIPKVSLALWPAVRGREILKLVDEGVRTFRSALDHIGWTGVEVPESAVTDADTPQELARLLAGRAD